MPRSAAASRISVFCCSGVRFGSGLPVLAVTRASSAFSMAAKLARIFSAGSFRAHSIFRPVVHTRAESGAACFARAIRSEEHTSELQSRQYLVCRLLLEKKKKRQYK